MVKATPVVPEEVVNSMRSDIGGSSAFAMEAKKERREEEKKIRNRIADYAEQGHTGGMSERSANEEDGPQKDESATRRRLN